MEGGHLRDQIRVLSPDVAEFEVRHGYPLEGATQIAPVHSDGILLPDGFVAEVLIPLTLAAEDGEGDPVGDHAVQRHLHAVLHIALPPGIGMDSHVADPAAG